MTFEKAQATAKAAAVIIIAGIVIFSIPIIYNFREHSALNKTIADQSAWPKDGTYIFEPRHRATQGDDKINQWLAKVVVQNGNLDLYFTNKPTGKGTRSGLTFGPISTLILMPWNKGGKREAVKSPVWDEESGAYIVTFHNVTYTQFSYFETEPKPNVLITGITLSAQDLTRNTARVSSNGLNLRARPSAGSGIVKTLRQGDRLSVTGVSRDGWLPVEHNGSEGWVNEKYITIE